MAIKLEGGGLNGLTISGGTFFLRLPKLNLQQIMISLKEISA